MEEDSLRLHVNGEEFFADRMNTTLFTFWGELAIFNHVFLQLGDEEDEIMQGAYIFKDATAFADIANFIVEHEFPMILNRPDCPPCDRQAWDNAYLGDLSSSDYLPVDWGPPEPAPEPPSIPSLKTGEAEDDEDEEEDGKKTK